MVMAWSDHGVGWSWRGVIMVWGGNGVVWLWRGVIMAWVVMAWYGYDVE